MPIQRREFVTSIVASGLAVPALAQPTHHGHEPLSGPLAGATVAFGAWPASAATPQNRFNVPSAPAAPNAHALLPYVTTIKAGGAVTFAISGFHVVAIYGPGTTPEDINPAITIPLPGAPPGFPPAIDDPNNRIYLGLNPFPLPQDRVEVVQFTQRGRYLVICAFVPHFADRMWGYVRVLP